MPIGDVSRWVSQFVNKFLRGTPNDIIQYDAEGYPQKVAPGWTSVFKTSDQSKNNDDALAADSALQFAMASGHTYVICGEAYYTCTANSDFKFSITGGQGSGSVKMAYLQHTSAAGTDNTYEYHLAVAASATYVASTTIAPATHTSGRLWFTVIITTTGDGTFGFNWAQETSHADSTTVKAGSYIEYKAVN